MFDRCQIVTILDFGKKGTSHICGNDTIVSGVHENPMIDIKTSLLLLFPSKVMRIFMFENGAMAAILEKVQFLAYAMNLEIPPSAFLKLVVSCTEISFQSLCPLRCIRVCMPGPGLI